MAGAATCKHKKRHKPAKQSPVKTTCRKDKKKLITVLIRRLLSLRYISQRFLHLDMTFRSSPATNFISGKMSEGVSFENMCRAKTSICNTKKKNKQTTFSRYNCNSLRDAVMTTWITSLEIPVCYWLTRSVAALQLSTYFPLAPLKQVDF
jgi:hypothetical protein